MNDRFLIYRCSSSNLFFDVDYHYERNPEGRIPIPEFLLKVSKRKLLQIINKFKKIIFVKEFVKKFVLRLMPPNVKDVIVTILNCLTFIFISQYQIQIRFEEL